MSSSGIIEFHASLAGLSFRAQFVEDNPDVVHAVKDALPVASWSLHVVVAGDTFLMPAPIDYLGQGNPAPRVLGSVYYNMPNHSICVCYGKVYESTKVNTIAHVLEDDREKLIQFGTLVRQLTLNEETASVIQIDVRMLGDTTTKPCYDGTIPKPEFDGTSQSAKAIIDWQVTRLHQPEEPDEFKNIRLGNIEGAGSDGCYFTVFVFGQGWLSMLGAHVVARLMRTFKTEEYSLKQMIAMMRGMLFAGFDHFKFLGDLGLKGMHATGKIYDAALDKLETPEQFYELTESLRAYLIINFRWFHLIFPWHINKRFPKRTPEEVAEMPKLLPYPGTGGHS